VGLRVHSRPLFACLPASRGRSYLSPVGDSDRGLAAIVETARHEFAHLNGLGQGQSWDYDPGAQLATDSG
jgi:hypothetical protein